MVETKGKREMGELDWPTAFFLSLLPFFFQSLDPGHRTFPLTFLAFIYAGKL